MAASAEDSGVWAVGMEEGRAWWRGMWQAENLERLVALEKIRLLTHGAKSQAECACGPTATPRSGETAEPEPAPVD